MNEKLLNDLVQALLVRDIDLKARRVKNASDSKDMGDYVTKRELNRIGVYIGFGEDGTITGAIIRTAESGARIEFDPTVGFKVINSIGNTVAQFAINSDYFRLLEMRPLATGVDDGVQIRNGNGTNLIRVRQVFEAIINSHALVFNTAGELLLNTFQLATALGFLMTQDEAYGAGWNGSLQVPTKNAVYDKIQSVDGDVTTAEGAITTLQSQMAGKADAVAGAGPTIVTAPLTGGGTTGSITFNSQGLYVSHVDAT